MGTRTEDVVEYLVIASTHAYLLVFTNKGRVYWLKIYEIPDAGTTGKGKHISGLINLQADEAPTAFLPVKEFVPDHYIVMVTQARRHQEVRADGVRQSARPRHHRDQHRRRRRIAGRQAHQWRELYVPRLARRHGQPLRGEPSARHGPRRARCPRHGSGRRAIIWWACRLWRRRA